MSFAVPVQTLYHWLMKPMGTGQLKKKKQKNFWMQRTTHGRFLVVAMKILC